MNKRSLGTEKERQAAAYLKAQGCRILTTNFRSKRGEIDLIMTDAQAILCFVEVKYRKDDRTGDPAQAVTSEKAKRICRCADFYRIRYGISEDQPCRFDVVAILGDQLRWIKDAFPYQSEGGWG